MLSKPLLVGPPDRSQAVFRRHGKDRLRGLGRPFMREPGALIAAHDVAATTLATAVFEGSVDPYLCDVGGTLYGSAASTTLDSLTGEALHVVAWEGKWTMASELGVGSDVFEAGGDGGVR